MPRPNRKPASRSGWGNRKAKDQRQKAREDNYFRFFAVYCGMPGVPRSAPPVALVAALLAQPAGAAGAGGGRPDAIPEPLLVLAGETMVIDGRLDERTWEQAAVIKTFVQREPAEGLPPSHGTEARVAFDDDALYVAIRALDSEPDRIVGILTRRDQPSPSDWVKVIVDSYFDHRSAYEFAVNPVGVKRDRYYFNDGPSDESWDAVWDVEVGARLGRLARRVPDPVLAAALQQQRWRSRRVRAGARSGPPQRDLDLAAALAQRQRVRLAVRARCAASGRGARRSDLELMPYTVGTVEHPPGRVGQHAGAARPTRAASVGLDLKYAVTPGLTLTATANPDFGQVEADPAVVNLDAFEVLFPERRPFFVEGSGTFRFNMDCNDGNCTGLFYSRRIGRAPQGEVEAADDEYSTMPEAATILGAAKLTGRTGQFSVGMLTAVTANEYAEIAGSEGLDHREQLVEPQTTYSVARARREFANQSNVGFMFTSTNRKITEDVQFLPDNAFTGGVDYDWRLSQKYNVTGYWAGSHVRGSTEAITRLQKNTVHSFQRPDADYTELDETATTLSGHAGSVAFGKIGGERTRFNSFVGYKTPGFDVNDLGYQRRADETHDEQLVPVPRLRAEPVRAQLERSTSTSGRAGTSAAIASFRAGTSTRTGRGPTTTTRVWA